MKKYYPILLAKAGELNALQKLTDLVKRGISPILQVIPNSYDKVLKFASENWAFDDNQLLLDFSNDEPFNHLETSNFIESILLNGTNVIPVISTQSGDQYLQIVQDLIDTLMIDKISLRLTIKNDDLIDVNNSIDLLLDRFNIKKENVLIIIDFAVVSMKTYSMYADVAENIIKLINDNSNFNSVIVSSGSFPENLTPFLSSKDPHSIQRYEWLLWKNLLASEKLKDIIKYSDYGTKYPIYTEAGYLGTCSIKYSIENTYLIYRGEKPNNHKLGNGQYITFSNALIKSPHFLGENYSWGDKNINTRAFQLGQEKQTPGNSQSWVEFSQNHHITMIYNLL